MYRSSIAVGTKEKTSQGRLTRLARMTFHPYSIQYQMEVLKVSCDADLNEPDLENSFIPSLRGLVEYLATCMSRPVAGMSH